MDIQMNRPLPNDENGDVDYQQEGLNLVAFEEELKRTEAFLNKDIASTFGNNSLRRESPVPSPSNGTVPSFQPRFEEDLKSRLGDESSSNRPYIPEDRRREIIAQLTAERRSGSPPPPPSPPPSPAARYRTREERDEMIQALLASRASRSGENLSQHLHAFSQEIKSPAVYEAKSSIMSDDEGSLKSPRSSEAGGGSDTFFYASDILHQSNAEVQPRSHMELFYGNEQNDPQLQDETIGSFVGMNRLAPRVHDNTVGGRTSHLNEREHTSASATFMLNDHDAPSSTARFVGFSNEYTNAVPLLSSRGISASRSLSPDNPDQIPHSFWIPPAMVQSSKKAAFTSTSGSGTNAESSSRSSTRVGSSTLAPPPAPSQVKKTVMKGKVSKASESSVSAKTSVRKTSKAKGTTTTSAIPRNTKTTTAAAKTTQKKKKTTTVAASDLPVPPSASVIAPKIKLTSTRLEYLAQPRHEQFAAREKRRLLQEMLTLQECTFKPNLYQEYPKGSHSTDGQSHHQQHLFNQHHEQQRRSPSPRSASSSPRQAFGGRHTLEWLTLSPRQQQSPYLKNSAMKQEIRAQLKAEAQALRLNTRGRTSTRSSQPSKGRRSRSLDDKQDQHKGDPNGSNDKKEQGLSRREIIERLHLEKPKWLEMRDKAKQEKEEKEFRQHCTFKPKINPMSEYMIAASSSGSDHHHHHHHHHHTNDAKMDRSRPFHERLGDLQRAKNKHLCKLREQIEAQEKGLTFKPKINSKSREIAMTVHLSKDLKEQDEECIRKEQIISKLKALELAGLDLEQTSSDQLEELFRLQLPHLMPPTGTKTNSSTCMYPNVLDRLVKDAEKQMEKRLAVQEYYDALEQQPFAPTINANSHKIIEQKPEFQQMDFLTRQEFYQKIEEEEKNLNPPEAIQLEEANATFTPNIGNANEVLKVLRPSRLQETEQQQIYRMAYADAKQQQIKREQLLQAKMNQLPFKPSINPISRQLASQTVPKHQKALVERLAAPKTNSKDKQVRSRVILEMEQKEREECTFHPKLTTNGIGGVANHQVSAVVDWKSSTAIMKQLKKEKERKEKILEMKRNLREMEELKECTFQPKTNHHKSKTKSKANATFNPQSSNSNPHPNPHPQSSNPKPQKDEKVVLVRGLGKFLERQQLAKQHKQELKERQRKVFNLHQKYTPRVYTIPQPFNLSGSQSSNSSSSYSRSSNGGDEQEGQSSGDHKKKTKKKMKWEEEKEKQLAKECTFHPETNESKHRRLLEKVLAI